MVLVVGKKIFGSKTHQLTALRREAGSAAITRHPESP